MFFLCDSLRTTPPQKNYDTTEMYMKVDLMLRELDSMQGDYWDLEGFADGRNYTDKTEV